VLHYGDPLSFLSTPVLSGCVAANFAMLSRWLAALSVATFVCALLLYWADAVIPRSRNQPSASPVPGEPDALPLVTQVTWEIE
jgi:hypothetical protein